MPRRPAHSPPRRRVAFLDTLAKQGFNRPVLGALKYANEINRWDFVGRSNEPYISIKQIDPATVDGVIGLLNHPALVEAIAATGVHAVNVSNKFNDHRLPRVGHDEQAIGRLGAEHLLTCGFTQFAFLGWAEAWFAEQRMKAFQEMIEDAGHACLTYALPTYSGGEDDRLIIDWLASLPKPIAIMVFSDDFGTGVISAANRLSLTVPDEVAVLSVNNTWLATMMTRPPMSSIELDAEHVGYRAAKMLDELMADQGPPSPQWVEPIGVVERRSTQVVLHDNPLVTRAMRYIADHATEGITVTDVLEAVGVSRTTLENHMKRAFGQTPQVAIFRARFKHAKNLLTTTDQTLGQIAIACGFGRQDHFCTAFKRQHGMTPGQYRKQRSRNRP